MTVGLGAWIYGEINTHPVHAEMISPLASPTVLIQPEKAAEDAESLTAADAGKFVTDDMSNYISQAIQEFLPNLKPAYKSEALMIMHCLAHRESRHASDTNCGDSGQACGPFQFHPETWVRARKAMIADGFATEIGDKYDKKEAARTTVFAIKESEKSKPRIKITEWGPVLRYVQGSDYAACQYPSWLPEVNK